MYNQFIQFNYEIIIYIFWMINIVGRLSKRLVRTAFNPYKIIAQQNKFLFCSTKSLSPVQLRIKQLFKQKGIDSKQYQQQMGKAVREALSKQNNQEAIQLQLFHVGLIKQFNGENSEIYRNELRQISKFFINNMQFQHAIKLIEQLKGIEQKMQNPNPLDIISTYYLLGYVYMELDKFQQSKDYLYKCLDMKHVKQASQVFFKVYAQLARVHAKCNQNQQALKKIKKCQQILANRQFNDNSPPIIKVMDLHDVFNLCQLASIVNQRQMTQKYLAMYEKRLQKCSNKKDPMYAQFLQRKAKIYFNLKQFKSAVESLQEGVKICQQLGKHDQRFLQNIQILKNIAGFIKKQYIK